MPPSDGFGALAQLGERLICIQEVIGSIPIGSTKTLQVWFRLSSFGLRPFGATGSGPTHMDHIISDICECLWSSDPIRWFYIVQSNTSVLPVPRSVGALLGQSQQGNTVKSSTLTKKIMHRMIG